MTVNAITVFFVEDSAEDRALYQRFLGRDDRYSTSRTLSQPPNPQH
jgi:hypothetical protein